MPRSRQITIAEGAYIVASFFALFGSYLGGILPPVRFQNLVLGGVELIVLMILLIIARYQIRIRQVVNVWFLFLVTSVLFYFFFYDYLYSKTVVHLKNGPAVKGYVLRPEIVVNCQGWNIANFQDCESYTIRRFDEKFSNTSIWTDDSILLNEMCLLIFYTLFVLSISTMIFLLTDLNIERRAAAKSMKKPKKKFPRAI
jgi:hypothetical protein